MRTVSNTDARLAARRAAWTRLWAQLLAPLPEESESTGHKPPMAGVWHDDGITLPRRSYGRP